MRFALLAAALAFAGCSSAQLQQAANGNETGGGSSSGSDPTSDGSGDGGTGASSGTNLPTTSKVRLLVEPSDDASGMLEAIKSAKKSVHMTMYLLSADTVINALIARQKAGVEVKVVLNKNFPQAGTDQSDVFAKLQAAGIGVTWAKNTLNYTHAKTVIIDGAEAWIMTMNATFSAFRDNREYLAVDTEPSHVAQAESLFSLDYDGKSSGSGSGGDLVVAPSTARPMLLQLIDSAKSTVDVEVESISDDEIVGALGRAHDRGAQVRVIVADNSDTPAESDAHATLLKGGVSLVKVSKPYIHAKAIVVDGAVAFVGSENLTTNSLLNNREIGVLFDAPSEVKKLGDTIAADFALGK